VLGGAAKGATVRRAQAEHRVRGGILRIELRQETAAVALGVPVVAAEVREGDPGANHVRVVGVDPVGAVEDLLRLPHRAAAHEHVRVRREEERRLRLDAQRREQVPFGLVEVAEPGIGRGREGEQDDRAGIEPQALLGRPARVLEALEVEQRLRLDHPVALVLESSAPEAGERLERALGPVDFEVVRGDRQAAVGVFAHRAESMA
jgi:hypothetical protein